MDDCSNDYYFQTNYNDDEFQFYGKLYSLDYRTIEGDLSLEYNTLDRFKPDGEYVITVHKTSCKGILSNFNVHLQLEVFLL